MAHEYDIDLEGAPELLKEMESLVDLFLVEMPGACEGSVACSTCHVILEPAVYNKLPEPEDDENDMLDMAFGLTDT